MKLVLIRISKFFLPFLFLSIVLLVIDPYNFFNLSYIFSDEVKLKCINRTNESSPRGNMLWNTIEFKRNPTKNIVFGDSRISVISQAALEDYFEGNASNLGVAGSNIRSIIEQFWMATEFVKPNNVIIQLSFNTYSVEGSNFSLFTSTNELMNNPLSYFCNWDYLKDAFSLLYYAVSKNEDFVNRSWGKGENWENTTKDLPNQFHTKNYIYPKSINVDLQRISDYCKTNGINLVFLIPPSYFEANEFIKDAGLESYYNQFKNDLRNIGTTIDLDDGIPFSFDRNNYDDHFHLKPAVADTLISLMRPL